MSAVSGGGAEASHRDPVEIEVKLSVTRPRRIARLLRDLEEEPLGAFRADTPLRVAVQTDRYVDTAETGGRLFEQGMRARLRRDGRSVILAVKHSGIESAGITTRAELEGPATDSLDPARWPASDARATLAAAIDALPLIEIARLRQRRLSRNVRGYGAIIELSLDRVEAVVNGRAVEHRYELEAELKTGRADALARLLEVLNQVDGLGPRAGSKLAFAREARER